MKKSQYTERHIAFALKRAETGTRVEKACRKFGISQALLYNWKKKHGVSLLPEFRRIWSCTVVHGSDNAQRASPPRLFKIQ